MEKIIYGIKQNDSMVITGDPTTIGIVFKNMTGENFKKSENKDYQLYKNFVKEEDFELDKPFTMVAGDEVIKTGTFKECLC